MTKILNAIVIASMLFSSMRPVIVLAATMPSSDIERARSTQSLHLAPPDAPPTTQNSSAPGSTPTRTRNSAQVILDDTGFKPQILTVEVGTRVTWHNITAQAHTLQGGNQFYQMFFPLVQQAQRDPAQGVPVPSPSPRPSPASLSSDGFSFVTLLPGDTFTNVFSIPGDYAYYLKNKPQFSGRVIVEAGFPSRTPTATSTFSRTPTATTTSTTTVSVTPMLLGAICVIVYNDLNGNGTRDLGELLSSGASITVKNSDGVVVGVATTDGTLEPRCFLNLPAGNYTVTEVNSAGYTSTTPDLLTVVVPAGFTTNVEFGDNLPALTATPTSPRTPGVIPGTEWVNFYGLRVFVDGELAPVGTLVRAYNPRGVIAGEFRMAEAGRYGLMPVYRDDPQTAQDEGLRPSETVSFTVNSRNATVLGTDQALWTANGDLKRVDLAVGKVPASYKGNEISLPPIPKLRATPLAPTSGTPVLIPLRPGWNLVSFPVTPANSDAQVVLAPIAGLFSVVLSFDQGGLSYYPDLPPSMNTLRTMDAYHGYWIKMNSAGTFAVSGERSPENHSINLQAGWNLVSYLPRGAQDVSASLSSINGQFSTVLGYDQGALSYYPSLPPDLNTLKRLDLNHGYWIKMANVGILAYPMAAQTATPVPTATPILTLPASPTPIPTSMATPTLGPRSAPVYPPSIISSNTTWRASDGTYVINNTVTVNQAITLTIEPGVIVKFNSNTGLVVNGTLIAEGTASAPIVFTSIRDDAYAGDTNSDGTMSTPGAGDWGSLYIGPTSTGSRLKYTRVTYGGQWNYLCGTNPYCQAANLYVSGASPMIDNVNIEYGTTYGLLLANSAIPTVSNSRIAHIAGIGVRINSSSAPTLQNNVIESNNGYAIFMEANTAPRFSGNRALNNSTNGIGVSGVIAPSVTWDSDLTYVIDGDLSINAGISLTLQPGAVLKFKDQSQSLTVNGTLHATGVVTSSIVFTSLKDDTVGGDTNNDGSASRPAPGDWEGITFSNSSTNSLLEYGIVRFAGASTSADVTINGSAPTISHSQITNSNLYGLRLTNVAMPTISDSTISDNNGDGLNMASSSAPTLTNNGFVNNSGYAIRMDGTCSFSASGNTASNNTFNAVGVSGAVPANTTWQANLPYVIDGGITVNTSIILTIQPGVVVKFRSGNLLVNGTLRTNGTAGNKIVFTSLNDTTESAAGQTLGRLGLRAIQSALAPGDWDRIEFASTSSASTLNYVVVRYGGSGSYGSVYFNGSAPSISNSIISYSRDHGLYVSGSSPAIMSNVFAANGNAGIYATSFANPTIQNNQIYSNTQYGILNNSNGVTIDATNNWWGSASGPTHSSNSSGTGDRVSNGVSFTPWQTSPTSPSPTPYASPTPTRTPNYVGGTISAPTTWTLANSPYVVNNDVTVNNSVILTIQPGVVVKFQSGKRITVNGTLAASGTVSNTIVFTSDKDDAYGGDTNGDGTATRPAAGNWGSISLNASASASTLANTLIRYAITGVQITGSSPTLSNATVMFSSGAGISVSGAGAPIIQNSVLRENLGAGINLSGSSPQIQGNTFVSNGDAAITMDGNSLPDNSNNQAYYNKYNGIKASGTVGTRGTWHKDLPYILGGVSVSTGVVLTIEPGTIVKFTGDGLTVNGGLIANGATSNRTVFTSIHDDSVGGDTNNNGSQTWPAPGDWSLIQFGASSLSSSSLTYADITYGGVKVTGSAPTIANDLIAYANGYGLQVVSLGTPTIQNNIIRDNRNNGLQLESSSAPTVQNNQFIRNQGYAVHMDASCTPTFIGNTATDNRANGVGVSGNATATTTWKANLTYIIDYNVTINAGVTLTLEPGTVVKFTSNAYITANGNLVAAGISTSKIVFTSLKDDTAGGDTNNDGNASTPAAGDWSYMQFTSSSTGSRFDQSFVRYGGSGSCNYTCPHAILLDGVAFSIQNTALSQSGYYGLRIKNASPTVNNVDISTSQYGILLESANPTITNSNIHDNTQYGIYGTGSNPTITGSTISNSKQGLYLASTNAPYPSISGNTFANNLTYAASIEVGALPTFGANTFVGTIGNGVNVGAGTLTQNATMYGAGAYVIGKIMVEQGATLTIQPGAVVKAYGPYNCYSSCAGIVVKGSLTANGQAASPIVFTSARDDSYGGDANADGTQTGPSSGDWAGVYFGPTSSTSTIENANIKYAGSPISDGSNSFSGGLSINNSSPTIRNSTLQNNSSYGIYLSGASPTITGTTISGQDYGIYAVSNSFPSIAGNTMSSRQTGIYLDDSSHATLNNNSFTSNSVAVDLKADALPYVGQNAAVSTTGNYINVRSGSVGANATIYSGIVYRLDDVVVNSGVVLTAQSGSITKFAIQCGWYCYRSGSLLVRGRLDAQGSSSQKIIFTAERDDTYGGDTNNDGANTTPTSGQWQGIYLSTSDSSLNYVVIKYGSSMTVDGTGYGGMLILNNVSPTISNSTIARGSGYGIQVINANPNINNNDIWGNGYGIYTQNGARPTIRDNNLHDNASYGVYNADNTLIVDATSNAWGHDSGPAPVGAGNGVNYTDGWSNGQLVRTYHVSFDPWNGKTNWIEQNLGVLKQWIAYVAEPVNTATGNYTYNYQDLRIPGRGLSLDWQRFYNSQGTNQGFLGYGWTCSYCMNVREDSGNALVTNEDGRVDKYAPDGNGGYTPPKGGYDTLTKSGSAFTLKRKDQTRYNFNGSGKLASIVDKNGNTITLSYSGSNLTTIADPTGRLLTLSYDGSNRITQITDPASRAIRFAYDEFSNLISATDARGNITRYAYDSKHRLLTITDPNNHIFVTNIYDSEGRVVTQRDAKLNNTTFSYDIYSKVTTVTDPRNAATTYTYDSELRLQSERNAAGQTVSYGYDASSNRDRVTDRRGNITRYGYDSMGNTIAITDALSSVTRMTYDGTSNLTSQTDPLGRTSNYTYDAKGNLTRTTDALSNSTNFAYNANGLMTSTTDARGNATAFGYDSHGNQTSVTDSLGNQKTLTYDIAGRKLTESDALSRTTTYTYDANNNVLTITNAAGGITTFTYDTVGNRLTATDPLERVTTYAYDQKDKLASVTNPLSGVTRYTYDANDNKITETDPLNHTTNFTYDSLNRLTQVTNPLNHTTRYGYDVDSNRTSVTDANGKTTNFAYDALNRLTQVTDPLVNTTSYAYDAVGNKIRVIDPNGNTTYYEYDALNRLTKVTDALGGIVRYGYDPIGNKTSMTDANSHATTYTYDALNRLTRVTDPLSNHVDYGYDTVGNRTRLTNARGQATTYTYDNLNRLTRINYPDSSSATYSYDAVGNRTQMVDVTGMTTYAYDALNRVTSVTNPGSRVVGYSYDAAGNRTGITYPDGKTVTYTYDDANRLTRASDWNSRQTNYTYDNAGNLTGQANPNNTSISMTYDAANRLTGLINTSTVSGTVASFSYTIDKVGNRTRVVDTEGTTSYEYDKLYRLTAVTYPDAKSAAYQYDPMGNRKVMTTTLGVTNYTYDAADRLQNAGATTFTWDADGNMLSKSGMAFTYNGINRLTQVVSGTLTVGFAYDGDGRRASKTVNGTATNYTYDTIAGLAYVLAERTGSDTSLYTYGSDLVALTDPSGVQSYYHYDGLGSTRALSNGSGQVTARYSYDVFGATRSSSGASPNAFKFAGEQTDDELGLIYLRARYYDPSMGRFMSKDPKAGHEHVTQSLNLYPYSQNNPVTLTDPSGELVPLLIGAALVGIGLYKGLEAVATNWERTMGSYGRALNMIGDPSATAEDYDLAIEGFKSGFRDTQRSIFELALTTGGTSFTGPAGLPTTWGGLILDTVKDKLWGAYVKHELGAQSPSSRPQTCNELPSATRSQSRLASRLGALSFQAWSVTRRSTSSTTAGNYEAYIATTPIGRLVQQVAQGTRHITQDEIRGSYVLLSQALRQAGFNPANPQSPPSHSK